MSVSYIGCVQKFPAGDSDCAHSGIVSARGSIHGYLAVYAGWFQSVMVSAMDVVQAFTDGHSTLVQDTTMEGIDCFHGITAGDTLCNCGSYSFCPWIYCWRLSLCPQNDVIRYW